MKDGGAAGVRTLFCCFLDHYQPIGSKSTKQLRLFDVWMPNHGFIPPNSFGEGFGRLPIAEAVYEGPFDREFIEAVKAGKYPVREGVVAKGTISRGDRVEVWSAKVKTKAWLDELARRAAGSEGLRRELADNLSEQVIASEEE